MWRIIPLFVVIGAVAACGGGSNDEATAHFARQMNSAFLAVNGCNDHPDAAYCFQADTWGWPDELCLHVELGNATLAREDVRDEWEGADFGRFEDVCKRWEVVREMPVITGRAEVVKLNQEVEEIWDSVR